MPGALNSCCCQTKIKNCKLSALIASKQRIGFQCLHDTAWNGYNKLRFLHYRQRFLHEGDDGAGAGWYVVADFNAEATIHNTRTGRLTYSDNAPSAFHRANWLNQINDNFGRQKNRGSNVITSGGREIIAPGLWRDWTKVETTIMEFHPSDNKSIVGFTFILDETEQTQSTIKTYSKKTMIVEVGSEYTDEMLKTEVTDLLENYNTGTANGVLGLDDDRMATIRWVEAYGALGFPPWSNNIAWDINQLAGGSTIPDQTVPELFIRAPASHYGVVFQWWQHTGGQYSNGEVFPYDEQFSKYRCTFTDDGSIPTLGAPAADMSNLVKGKYRFGIANTVCGSWEVIKSGVGYVEPTCKQSEFVEGYEILTTPDCVVENVRTIRVPQRPFFTSPGYLTDEGCPCISAP